MCNRRLFSFGAVLAAIAVSGCDRHDGDDIGIVDVVSDAGIACAVPPEGGHGGGGAISPLFNSVPVQPDSAPPPISGGTLLASADGTMLIAADPDRDAIYVIDAATRTLSRRIALEPGDEPGRVAEDKNGKFHVSLRGGGAIASFGTGANDPLQRTPVCSLPRGLAYEPGTDRLYVACAEGKLVEVDPNTATALRKIELGRDLRDVVVRGSTAMVSRFRTAELLEVGLADGKVMGTRRPNTVMQPETVIVEEEPPAQPTACTSRFTRAESRQNHLESEVAWRMVDVPGAGIAMLHQRAGTAEVQVLSGGYGAGGGCSSGIVRPALSMLDDLSRSVDLTGGGLLVDLASDQTGEMLAVANPGGWGTLASVMLYRIPNAGVPSQSAGSMDRSTATAFPSSVDCHSQVANIMVPGQATAVSFVSPWMLAVQEREPAAISFYDVRTQMVTVRLDLQQPSREDGGHTLFHLTTEAGIACASCHAEAGDDGHVWTFHGIGPRRTQNLRGGILGTEPFHWNGDMRDFSMLVHEVFEGRMSAPKTTPSQANALAQWIDDQPALHADVQDAAAVERGKALFESEGLGCTQCHNGARFSNNESADVGTGAILQVPSLRAVSFRAPFMHDGCATSLAARFGACGGGDKHGKTSQLTAAQINDVVAYLESL